MANLRAWTPFRTIVGTVVTNARPSRCPGASSEPPSQPPCPNPCDEPPPPLLLKGIEQFNRGEFFEQHETLEELWKQEPRDIRRFYQGILQIGVAFHHVRRGNHHGAVYMLARGSAYLQPFGPICQRVDVTGLLESAGRALAAIEALGPQGLDRFDWSLAPTVRLV